MEAERKRELARVTPAFAFHATNFRAQSELSISSPYLLRKHATTFTWDSSAPVWPSKYR